MNFRLFKSFLTFRYNLFVINFLANIFKYNKNNEVIKYIAQNVKNNIRELESSLKNIILYSRLIKRPVDIDLANDYLNIPVLLNAYVAKGFAIKAGVQPGILMSAKAKGKSNGQKASKSIKDYYNTFDVAIPLGISYETEDGFIIDARYNLGLLDVIKNNTDKACRNCVAQITLGYKF